MTDGDTFDVLVRHYAGEDAWFAFERAIDDGSLTLRDALQAEAGCVRATFEEGVAKLRAEIAVDPTFAAFAKRCVARGYALSIVSSGVEPVIRDRLADFELPDLPVVANGLVCDPSGWRIVFRERDAHNGTDKAALVRASATSGLRTVFIGDGRSDYEAAVIADLRYAKRNSALERHLLARGVEHRTFTSFADVEF